MEQLRGKYQDNANFHSTITLNEEYKQFSATIDFENTAAGDRRHKIFKIQNESTIVLQYIINRDPNRNPLYQVFDLNLFEAKVAPGDYFEVKVTFKPVIPCYEYVDNFHILDSTKNFYKVSTKGYSEGPRVQSSTKLIRFFITSLETFQKHVFEIKNCSNIPAKYQFDIDSNECVFKVDKRVGTLGPKEHKFIKEPITVELFGLFDNDFSVPSCDLRFLNYPQPHEDTKGFFGYMSDCVKVRHNLPPVTLSETYLDFGSVYSNTTALQYCEIKKQESRSLTTCLTNHLGIPLNIIWDDTDDIFKIYPRKVTLPSQETALFEVSFTPNVIDSLFMKILTAQLYWKDEREATKISEYNYIEVPLAMRLTLTGDSFPEKERWIANVTVEPQVIIMHPTVPNYAVYGTFFLNSQGYLPVSFKFISPKRSNYILKPMIGIFTSHQIVVIQLQPDGNQDVAYIEYWEVQLNGRKDRNLPFYIKGFSALPSLVVGCNNNVDFGCIRHGCEESIQVAIWNNSVHCIEYSFQLSEIPYLNIEHPIGILPANKLEYVPWYIRGYDNLPMNFTVSCNLYSLQNLKIVFGDSVSMTINVLADLQISNLCVIPNEKDLGTIRWGTNETISFHIFNFGSSSIHYQLFCFENDDICHHNDLTITPEMGTVWPLDKDSIVLQLLAKTIGIHELTIRYNIRRSQFSPHLVLDYSEFLFVLRYNCLYPTIQVLDINTHNFGPNFSKIQLWKALNLNRVNEYLKVVQHNETKVIESFIPDNEESTEHFYMTFVLYNTTVFNTNISFKRKKVCDCPLVQISKGISLRGKIYDCKHRDMFEIVASSKSIDGKAVEKVTVNVKYTEPGCNIIAYKILLCDDRVVEWVIQFNILPVGITAPSLYSHVQFFHMALVNIQCKRPPVQAYHIYNNSNGNVFYSIDTRVFEISNEQSDYNLMECLNPVGQLLPFQNDSVLFRFSPLRYSPVQIVAPSMVGGKPLDITVIGCSFLDFEDPFYVEEQCDITVMPYSFNTDANITLSCDKVRLVHMMTWGKTSRVIFIKNLTSDKTYGYSWENRIVEGIVSIKTRARKGILEPKESHPVIIDIETFDEPCKFSLLLACNLLNHTQHLAHLKSLDDYKKKEKELEGQFTITEEGTFYPENNVVIVPKPKLEYITLDIEVVCVSVLDRDLYHSTEIQYCQYPQYMLRPDIPRLLENITLLKTEETTPITTFATDKMKESLKDKRFIESIKISLHDFKKSHIGHLRTYGKLVEQIIGDMVFSKIFFDIMMKLSSKSSPFYEQILIDPETVLKKSGSADGIYSGNIETEIRRNFVKDTIDRTQPPHCEKLLKIMLNESIHEAMQLGPQIQNSNRPTESVNEPSSIMEYKCGCVEPVFDGLLYQ